MTVDLITAPELRRLHPLTPLFKSWRLIAGAGAVGFGVFRDELDKLRWVWHALNGDVELTVVMKGALVLAAIALVSALAAWLSWRVTGFVIVPDDHGRSTLLFHRGLFVKQRSKVRLDRVQAVDVNEPLVPRLVGLAAVKLDMAAGEGASVDLAYLSSADAWQLREEILRHSSAAVRAAPEPAGTPAPESIIADISTARLIQANLLDAVFSWAIAVLWVVGIVVVAVGWGTTVLVAWLSGIIPVTIAIAAQTRRQVLDVFRDGNFRLTRTANGIRTSSGLTSTVNKTIDHERIQGVRLVEPYLWRRLGWARVMVDVAGGKDDDQTGVPLMPVADRAVALALVRDVVGEDLANPVYEPAGARARVLDPLSWRSLGVSLLDGGAVRRRGRWRMSTSYVPYARVQSVSAEQGPVQRRLGLATVHLDLPKGAERWTAAHRAHGDAAALVVELGTRAREHRLREDAARPSVPDLPRTDARLTTDAP